MTDPKPPTSAVFMVGEPPPTSAFVAGKPASTVPVGFKLGEGWGVEVPPSILGGAPPCVLGDCQMDARFYRGYGACPVHAVELGAIVTDESVSSASQPDATAEACDCKEFLLGPFEAPQGTSRTCTNCGQEWISVVSDSSDVPGEHRWIEKLPAESADDDAGPFPTASCDWCKAKVVDISEHRCQPEIDKVYRLKTGAK